MSFPYRYTTSEETKIGGVLSTITILRTQRNDTATFTCAGSNEFGSDYTVVNLAIQEKPETPFGLNISKILGTSITLSWQEPYNGNSNLTKYITEFKPSGKSWTTDIQNVLVSGDQVYTTVHR